jgi:hypothetical protein
VVKLVLEADDLVLELDDFTLAVDELSFFILEVVSLIVDQFVEVIDSCKLFGNLVFKLSRLGCQISALFAFHFI